MNSRNFQKTPIATSLAFILGSSLVAPIYAQEANTENNADSDVEIIQVRGIRGSVQEAMGIKRESAGIVADAQDGAVLQGGVSPASSVNRKNASDSPQHKECSGGESGGQRGRRELMRRRAARCAGIVQRSWERVRVL